MVKRLVVKNGSHQSVQGQESQRSKVKNLAERGAIFLGHLGQGHG